MVKTDDSSIKAVVFDLFSTLTSLTHLPDAPGRMSHEILGVDPYEWKNALFDDSRERLIGTIRKPVEIMRDIAWKIDPTIKEETLELAARERRIRFTYCLENPPAGVIESLEEIKAAGYSLALISNADAVEIEAWPDTKLGRLFDTAVFSCHEGTMKPEPAIFRLCLDKIGLAGSQCLYVGDGGNGELIASAREGMTAVLTTQFLKTSWPEKIEERRQTVKHEIGNLSEILPLLAALEKQE